MACTVPLGSGTSTVNDSGAPSMESLGWRAIFIIAIYPDEAISSFTGVCARLPILRACRGFSSLQRAGRLPPSTGTAATPVSSWRSGRWRIRWRWAQGDHPSRGRHRATALAIPRDCHWRATAIASTGPCIRLLDNLVETGYIFNGEGGRRRLECRPTPTPGNLVRGAEDDRSGKYLPAQQRTDIA
jgi:hypothetical protein